MIKEIKNGSFIMYEDENGNLWENCTIERAEKLSQSLVNCTGCINCEDCVGCNNCVQCVHCKNCEDCKLCNGCDACRECISCEGCSLCEECGGLDSVKYMNEENTKRFINWIKRKNNIDN